VTALTQHGAERMRERAGLSRPAAVRIAERAYANGLHPKDFSGSFRRYLDGLYLSHGQAANIRVYGEHVYLFSVEGRLITTLWLPKHFKKTVAKTRNKQQSAR